MFKITNTDTIKSRNRCFKSLALTQLNHEIDSTTFLFSRHKVLKVISLQ
jgi:hypothetical protein